MPSMWLYEEKQMKDKILTGLLIAIFSWMITTYLAILAKWFMFILHCRIVW